MDRTAEPHESVAVSPAASGVWLGDVGEQLSKKIRREWTKPLAELGADLAYEPARNGGNEDARRSTAVLWLRCDRPRQFTHVHRASEGIALLNILQAIDAWEWKDILDEIWMFDEEVDLETLRATPTALGLSMEVNNVQHLEWISERVVGVEPMSEMYEATFSEVKRALLTCVGDARPVCKAQPTIPVVLHVHIEDQDNESCDRVLRRLLEIAVTQDRQMRLMRLEHAPAPEVLDSPQERTRFQVVEFDIKGAGMELLDQKGLDYLCRIAELGVRVSRLSSLDVEPESKLALTNAMHVLFPPEAQSRRQFFGVEKVDIDDSMNSAMIASLLSAIHAARPVVSVNLFMEREPPTVDDLESRCRRSLWRWIAYVFFSHHARRNVREIMIDAQNLDQTDIAEVHKVINSPNPLKELFNIDPCQHHEFVQASTFYFAPECNDREAAESRAFRSIFPITVRVIQCTIETNSDWYMVLLSGRGKAWVHQEDITPVSSEERPPNEFPSLKHVRFVNATLAKQNCISLLHALQGVVESIEAIEYEYAHLTTLEDWYPSVLSTCVGLKNLTLRSPRSIGTLKRFVELAESGTSKLEVLVLGCPADLGDDGVLYLLRTLADVSHPFTKHLRKLELAVVYRKMGPYCNPDNYMNERALLVTELCSTVENMLSRNRHLHTLTFNLDNIPGANIYFDDERAIRVAPLALRSKLGLLSVLAHEAIGTVVDSSVLAIIFQFAAEHQVRRVRTTWTLG